MLPAALSEIDERVLMLAPTGRDGELICNVLEDAGVRCRLCPDMLDLCRSLHEGGAALLIAEEALADGAYRDLVAVLAQQPPWSEPPILLLSERGADSDTITEALLSLGNVTVLERPTRVPTLVSAVHSALRSRNRQYQIRSYIEEREQYAEALREADHRKDVFLATLAHERSIREFRLSSGGISVGEPLRQFRGVLTGVPVYDGTAAPLMKGRS